MEHQASPDRACQCPVGTFLCADDFAQSASISAGIASLARAGRIDAVSAMAVMPGWPRDSQLLADRAAHVQVGLHLVLCDEFPLGPMPNTLSRGRLPGTAELTRRALTGRLDADEFSAEIERQFAAFFNAMGEAPDFVDGHKHCHLLPVLRTLVLDATARYAPKAWLRSCEDRASSMLARPFRWKALGSALWSWGFRGAANKRHLVTNDSFAGHYNYKGNFAKLLPRFRQRPGRFHVIMCHPGNMVDRDDPIGDARAEEFETLRG